MQRVSKWLGGVIVRSSGPNVGPVIDLPDPNVTRHCVPLAFKISPLISLFSLQRGIAP